MHFWILSWKHSLWILIKLANCTCVRAKSLQLCPILCNPRDHNPPGSSVPMILQARILEWLPCLSPGDLPDPGIEPLSLMSPAFFTTDATWEAPTDKAKGLEGLGHLLRYLGEWSLRSRILPGSQIPIARYFVIIVMLWHTDYIKERSSLHHNLSQKHDIPRTINPIPRTYVLT